MKKLAKGIGIGALAIGTLIGCEQYESPITANNEYVASAPSLVADAHEVGFATTKTLVAVFPNGKIDRIGHFLEGTQKWICYFDDAEAIPTADEYVTLTGVYLGTLSNGRKVLAGVNVQ